MTEKDTTTTDEDDDPDYGNDQLSIESYILGMFQARQEDWIESGAEIASVFMPVWEAIESYAQEIHNMPSIQLVDCDIDVMTNKDVVYKVASVENFSSFSVRIPLPMMMIQDSSDSTLAAMIRSTASEVHKARTPTSAAIEAGLRDLLKKHPGMYIDMERMIELEEAHRQDTSTTIRALATGTMQ